MKSEFAAHLALKAYHQGMYHFETTIDQASHEERSRAILAKLRRSRRNLILPMLGVVILVCAAVGVLGRVLGVW